MHPILLTEPGVELPPSELILNPDGSIYHLALRPEHLGDVVLVVGDPGRVALISQRFDAVEHRSQNREFVAHTGTYHGRRITAAVEAPASAVKSPLSMENRPAASIRQTKRKGWRRSTSRISASSSAATR